jgi:hypothetical protein
VELLEGDPRAVPADQLAAGDRALPDGGGLRWLGANCTCHGRCKVKIKIFLRIQMASKMFLRSS